MRNHKAKSALLASAGLLVLLLAATAVGCGSGGSGDTAAQQAAPTFDLATISGGQLTSEGLKGKPTLLTFSASW